MIMFVLQLMFGRWFNINKKEAKKFAIEKVNVAKISLCEPKYTQVPALRSPEAVTNLNRLYQTILNWFRIQKARNWRSGAYQIWTSCHNVFLNSPQAQVKY